MSQVMLAVRVLTVAAAGALALGPLAATAAPSPSPSPSLDKVLAPPPGSGFTELTTGVLHGEFSAHDWATTNASGADATETQSTLTKDGFVDGYGKTWAQPSAGHAMIEAVMAFSGGQGARKALTSLPASGASAALGIAVIAAIIVAIVAVIGFLAVRRRGSALPAMVGAGVGAPAGAVQMSDDGSYWWDGQTWRDAAHETPPMAQRSGDGTLWWDGRTWRPVPQAGQPDQPEQTQPPTS